MCGIGVIFTDKSEILEVENIFTLLKNRGPDSFRSITTGSVNLLATVLHIQGTDITEQPYVDSDGNYLLWNGEVFAGLANHDYGSNDTIAVAAMLQQICATTFSETNAEKMARLLSVIEGPYAFIYFHVLSKSVYFGRDPFGRRSLLQRMRNGQLMALSSVAQYSKVNADSGAATCAVWDEVPVDGIYFVSLADSADRTVSETLSWPASRVTLGRPNEENYLTNDAVSDTVSAMRAQQFLALLTAAVRRRVNSLHQRASPGGDAATRPCGVGVLFSGGIDSVLLAAVLHHALEDPREPVDLVNVTFTGDGQQQQQQQSSPDRLAAVMAVVELQTLFPTREWRLVHVDVTGAERQAHEEHVRTLVAPCDTHMDLNIGTAFWFAARGVGYLRQYSHADSAMTLKQSTGGRGEHRPLLRLGGEGAALGVGMTADRRTVLAQKRDWKAQLSAGGSEGAGGEDCRNTCLNSDCRRVYKIGCPDSLCKRCCDNARRPSGRSDGLGDGVDGAPSLPCPVHRSRAKKKTLQAEASADSCSAGAQPEDECPETGHGVTADCEVPELREPDVPYRSACRALLVGIGADEQMAGYGRHRTVFQRGGWAALRAELNVDLTRLWKRNLGRDDRCVSDSGREAWFPYLDEQLVAFLQQLPLNEVVDLDLPQGVGDKRILRLAAKQLGLGQCSDLVKRAIQFGTGVAKHTNVLYHGSNRKGNGTTKL